MSHNPYRPPSTTVADIDTSASLERPRNATIAVRIFWATAIIGLISGIVSLFTEEMPPELPRSVVLSVALIFAIGFYGLYFWIITATGKGKNWGRITLTVLISIGLIFMLAVLALVPAPGEILGGAVENLLYMMQVILQTAAIVLLYTPSSNVWYAAKRAASY